MPTKPTETTTATAIIISQQQVLRKYINKQKNNAELTLRKLLGEQQLQGAPNRNRNWNLNINSYDNRHQHQQQPSCLASKLDILLARVSSNQSKSQSSGYGRGANAAEPLDKSTSSSKFSLSSNLRSSRPRRSSFVDSLRCQWQCNSSKQLAKGESQTLSSTTGSRMSSNQPRKCVNWMPNRKVDDCVKPMQLYTKLRRSSCNLSRCLPPVLVLMSLGLLAAFMFSSVGAAPILGVDVGSLVASTNQDDSSGVDGAPLTMLLIEQPDQPEALDRSQVEQDEQDRDQDQEQDQDHWSQQQQASYEDQVAQPQPDNSQAEDPQSKLLGLLDEQGDPSEQQSEAVKVERRRLNRDRYLEPPPWLRHQPMRRDGRDSQCAGGVCGLARGAPAGATGVPMIVRVVPDQQASEEDTNAKEDDQDEMDSNRNDNDMYNENQASEPDDDDQSKSAADIIDARQPDEGLLTAQVSKRAPLMAVALPLALARGAQVAPLAGGDELGGMRLGESLAIAPLQLQSSDLMYDSRPRVVGASQLLLAKNGDDNDIVNDVYEQDLSYRLRRPFIDRNAMIRAYLSASIRVPEASILGLYPLNEDQILVRLDESALSEEQKFNLVDKYDLARGYITLNAQKLRSQDTDSQTPIISLILDSLRSASKGPTSGVVSDASSSNFKPWQVQNRRISTKTWSMRPQQLAQLQTQRPSQRLQPIILDESGTPLMVVAQPELLAALLATSGSAAATLGRSPEMASALLAATGTGSEDPGYEQSATGSRNELEDTTSAPAYLQLATSRRSFVALMLGLSALFTFMVLVKVVMYLRSVTPLGGRGRGIGRDGQRRRRRDSLEVVASESRQSSRTGDQTNDDNDDANHDDAIETDRDGHAHANKAPASSKLYNLLPKTTSIGSLWSNCSWSNSFEAQNKDSNPLRSSQVSSKQDDKQAATQPTSKDEAAPSKLWAPATLRSLFDTPNSTNEGNKTDDANKALDCDDKTRLLDSASIGGDSIASSNYRSSTSYIKSLIDVLSRARDQIPSVSVKISTRSSSGRGDSRLSGESSDEDEVDADYVLASGSEAAKGDQLMSQMDISAAHLILEYMEKHLEDKQRVGREWAEVNASKGSHSVSIERQARVALSKQNKAKNRNPKVVAYDFNRVKLLAGPSDYVNASYIYDDDIRKPTHIIAQGPTEQTATHFWQMVWEQRVSIIVMLTRLSELSGARMCHRYWPSTAPPANSEEPGSPRAQPGSLEGADSPPKGSPPASSRRGSVTSVISGHNSGGSSCRSVANNIICLDIPSTITSSSPSKTTGTNYSSTTTARLEIHLVSEHVVPSGDHLVRNFYMINRSSGETRTVTQFHYLDWADLQVPADVKSLLQFRRKVHSSHRNSDAPIMVHCGDGGGRSGTYVLIDLILERIKNGAKEIDPRATLEHLRDQRPGVCNSQKQFEFVLVALAEEMQIILDALPK